jgi:hypothetical protein
MQVFIDPPPVPKQALPAVGCAVACDRTECNPAEFIDGYGFAAGGLGTYEACERCGKFVSFSPDDEA